MALSTRIAGYVRPLFALRGSLMVLALSLTVLFAWGPPLMGAVQGSCDPCMTCGVSGTPIPLGECEHCTAEPISEVCQCCQVTDGSAQCCYKAG